MSPQSQIRDPWPRFSEDRGESLAHFLLVYLRATVKNMCIYKYGKLSMMRVCVSVVFFCYISFNTVTTKEFFTARSATCLEFARLV